MNRATWSTLYTISLAFAVGTLAIRSQIITRPLENIHSLTLFLLSIALLIFFWYWDTEKPGFKVKYECPSIFVYLTAVAVIFSFPVLNVLVLFGEPTFFFCGASLVYFTKTLLNGVFNKCITERMDLALNLLAVYSDVVASVIFGVYSVFSVVFVSDKNASVFLGCLVIVSYVTIIAIEGYYQLVVSTLKKLNVGRVYGVRSSYFGKPEGDIKILRKFQQRLGDISLEDVKKEGFKTMEDFQAEWIKINGNWDPDKIVTVYEFEVVQQKKDSSKQGELSSEPKQQES